MAMLFGLLLPAALCGAALRAWRGGRLGIPSSAARERRREQLRSEWRRLRAVDASDSEVELYLYDARTQRRYGWLVEGYRESSQGWEAVVLLRKLGMVLVLVAGTDAGVLLQALTALAVTLLAMLAHWRCRPLARSSANLLEELSLSASAFTILGGLICYASAADRLPEPEPSEGSEEAATGLAQGADWSQTVAWLCVLVSHGAIAIHVLGATCLASSRYCRNKWARWRLKQRLQSEVRQLSEADRAEAAKQREAELVSGDAGGKRDAAEETDPMLARHHKLEAAEASLQLAATQLRKMGLGLDRLREDWAKQGIGRLSLREDLAALSARLAPVSEATSRLSEESAVLHSVVRAETVQRSMGKMRTARKRFGLMGSAGWRSSMDETTNKYRIGDGRDMKMVTLPELDEGHMVASVPSAATKHADHGVTDEAANLPRSVMNEIDDNQ